MQQSISAVSPDGPLVFIPAADVTNFTMPGLGTIPEKRALGKYSGISPFVGE